jgi:hypothetical protein
MRRMRGQNPKPELHSKGKALGKGKCLDVDILHNSQQIN